MVSRAPTAAPPPETAEGTEPPTIDPHVAAAAAHLHYVSDLMPGITRERAGKEFVYRDPDGRPIDDPGELQRIKAIGIPPAWTEVWICPDRDGHIQATGRYLHETAGHTVAAKDYRTWAGTNLAVLECAFLDAPKATKRVVALVVKRVAEHLGNTPAVCRKCYIHPRVLSSYLDGSLKPVLAVIAVSVRGPELWAVEGFVMRLLEDWEPAPTNTAAASA